MQQLDIWLKCLGGVFMCTSAPLWPFVAAVIGQMIGASLKIVGGDPPGSCIHGHFKAPPAIDRLPVGPSLFPRTASLTVVAYFGVWKWRHVPVSVRLPFHGAQLAALRSRRKLPNPGEEQQTLVAGVPLQLGRNRLHSSLLYRKNKGKPYIIIPFELKRPACRPSARWIT